MPSEAGAARFEGLTAALQLAAAPGIPLLRDDVIIPTIDAQRGGIIRPRIRHVRVTAVTGALAAASMTGSLRVVPDPGFTWRLLRASAYVRNNTAGAQPREPTYRNLTYADIRITGMASRAAAPPIGGAGALEVCEEARALVSHTDAAAVAIADARITDDFDLLVTWTGAARGTWVGDLLLADSGELVSQSSVEFYFRRTPAAADVDKYVLCLSFLAAPRGMIP